MVMEFMPLAARKHLRKSQLFPRCSSLPSLDAGPGCSSRSHRPNLVSTRRMVMVTTSYTLCATTSSQRWKTKGKRG